MIFFNVEEVRAFLKANSVVFTLRKERREGHDLAVYGSYYKWKRIGDVNVKFVDEIRDLEHLEGYVEQSGFATVEEWMSKAHPKARFLYKVSLLESPETNPGTGKPLHWVVQYCSQVKDEALKLAMKGIKPPPFTWLDCLSWITIDKFETKEKADAFLEQEEKTHKHSFVGAALRVYPIYPAVTLNRYRSPNLTIPEALYESLAAEVPDVNDPNLINYWKTVDDKRIYLEGWCDKCFAGTGIGKYETQAKINYAVALTKQVLPRKAKERGLELIEGRFVETPDNDFLVGVTVGVYRKKTANPIGYRVGEPQETNAKKLIEFEVVESGNVPMLDDLAAALHCSPTLVSINAAIDRQFGPDAIGMWLCDSPEWAEKRYGPGEAYSVEIPPDAMLITDLGEDGKLWIWRKPGSNPGGHVERRHKTARTQWIERVVADFKALTTALDKAFKEENAEWRILRCAIGGSLKQYMEGRTELFRTPYSGISGAEAKGRELPKGYLSDIDAVCWVTEKTDVWHKGNLVMTAENKIEENPQKYLPRSRGRQCISLGGSKIESRYCSNPFRLPLDEPDLRRTHEVILHLRKPGETPIFGLEWKKKTGSNPGVFVEIRFLKDTPIITGVDMKQYGPFKRGDVAALPKENARVLIKMKIAERRIKPTAEPPFKKVMKGEVLTGYVEAAKVRRLGEAKEEVTPYMEEKIPLILSKLRAMQKITGIVRKADLYDAVRPSVTKVGFDETIAYLLRKGQIYSPRPDFLKSTEEEVMLAGEDTARLADLFLDRLRDAGVSLPSRFKGEFEKAMDIYKPYDENVELIEEAAHRIILRETGKEYPVGEALRKAREKVEKLLTEIREARAE